MEFFKKEKLKTTDLVLILIYLGLSLFVFIILFGFKTDYNQKILMGYIILGHFSIYGVFCRGLQYVSGNIIWLLISGAHVFIYYQLKDDPLLASKIGGTVASPLLYTWLLILILQVTRLISFTFFKKELVTILAYGKPAFGDEVPKLSDWILIIPNFAAFLFTLMAD